MKIISKEDGTCSIEITKDDRLLLRDFLLHAINLNSYKNNKIEMLASKIYLAKSQLLNNENEKALETLGNCYVVYKKNKNDRTDCLLGFFDTETAVRLLSWYHEICWF